MTTQPPRSPFETSMRDRANSTLSDVVMSDPLDAESPTTTPSSYSENAAHSTPTDTSAEKQSHVFSDLDKTIASSPLFRLPKELRLRIYSYCLTTKYSILWPLERLDLNLQTQLLRICRILHNETAPVLYSNMLHFLHPSDANMFLWAHNPNLGRMISKLLFQVRDRDVKSIWTAYLGSSLQERSLQSDYPNLRTLHIQYRSNFLHVHNGDLNERFLHWDQDRALQELCSSLENRVPQKCEVRVLVCSRLVADHVRALLETHPQDLERVGGFSGGDRRFVVRTKWRTIHASAVAALEIEGQEQMRFHGP